MPEHFSNFPNVNQIKVPEKESAEATIFRAETNKGIQELLKTNTDLRRVAVLLGAEKYLEVIQTRGTSPTYHFNVKSFVDDQIAQKTFLKLPGEFLKTNEVILPPDSGEIIIGSGEGIDPKKIIPRSQFLVELLSEMNLDYNVIEGENSPNMMRQLSYYAFIIQKINKLALINNEEGNATFIIHQFEGGFEEAKNYLEMSKEELKDLPQEIFSELIYPGDKEKWKMAMKDFLENGPRVENESLREKKEYRKSENILSFNDAREKIKSLGINSRKDYREKYKFFSGLPSHPDYAYKDAGWTDWTDFLNKEREKQKSEQLFSFDEARNKARELKFTSSQDYQDGYKKALGLPRNPNTVYKDKGWIDWGDFLGTGREMRTIKKILSFEEAQKKVREIGLKSYDDYKLRYKEFAGLPSAPNNAYRDKGWKNWTNFLGMEQERLSFEKSREKARACKFKNVEDYKSRYKDFSGLLYNPNESYKKEGWIDWLDFLGTERMKQQAEHLLSFGEARIKAREYGFKSVKDYGLRYKNVFGLPGDASKFYKDKGWIDWGDFLGTGREMRTTKKILSFEEAQKKVREIGFTSQDDYKSRYKEFADLPSSPYNAYQDKGWKGWDDFLGKK
ncbi:MAG: integrase repeat-containing protein [bacterium]|nr:integrase repeat-containing protein [bacterium]